jgi:hypothetical protein
MKKIIQLFLFALFFSISSVFAQGSETIKQLNFGIIGASYEFPIHKNISIAPFVGTDFELDWLTLGAKGNFYFNNLLGLPAEWDVYGGANAGFAIGLDNDANNKDGFNLGLHIGARWFWNDTWGVYAEFGGGTTAGTSGIGITMKL